MLEPRDETASKGGNSWGVLLVRRSGGWSTGLFLYKHTIYRGLMDRMGGCMWSNSPPQGQKGRNHEGQRNARRKKKRPESTVRLLRSGGDFCITNSTRLPRCNAVGVGMQLWARRHKKGAHIASVCTTKCGVSVCLALLMMAESIFIIEPPTERTY